MDLQALTAIQALPSVWLLACLCKQLMISAVNQHSDATHSMQMIHGWAKNMKKNLFAFWMAQGYNVICSFELLIKHETSKTWKTLQLDVIMND